MDFDETRARPGGELRKIATVVPQSTIVAQELLGVHDFVQAGGYAVLLEAD